MTPSTVDDGRELTHLVVKHRGRRGLDNSVRASGPNLIGGIFLPVLINQLMDRANVNLHWERSCKLLQLLSIRTFGLLHGTYWKSYRFFMGVQRGMQKPLWISRGLLISNVFHDAKVLPPKCKSPNPLWGNGAPATIHSRRTTQATRAVGSSASMQKSWVSVVTQRARVHDRPSRGKCKSPGHT
jgi:hypothetical protein